MLALLVAIVAQPQVVEVGKPIPVVMDVTMGGGFAGVPSVSALSALVAEGLRQRTRAEPQPINRVDIDRCRLSLGSAHITVCETQAALNDIAQPRALFIVRTQGRGEHSGLLLGWLDLEQVRPWFSRRLTGVLRSAESKPGLRRLTREITGLTFWSPPSSTRTLAETSAALRRFLEKAEGPIARAGLQKGGELVVRVAPPRAELRLDGRPLSTGVGALRLRNLEPGLHRLEVRGDDDFLPITRTVALAPGTTQNLVLVRPVNHASAWTGVEIAGWTTIAVGLATASYGVLEADHRPLGLNGPEAIRWNRPSTLGEGGDGPIVAGVAAGFLVTGVGLLATKLWRDDARSPVWDVIAAVLAGGLTYGGFELVQRN